MEGHATSNNTVGPNKTSSNGSENLKLSPEQIKFYKDNGYLVLKGLIDFPSLTAFKQRFIDIVNGRVEKSALMRAIKEPELINKKTKPEDYVNKLQEIHYDDVYIQYALNPRLYSVVSQLIGDDVISINSMFINKPLQEIHYDDVYIQYALNPRLYSVVSQLIGGDVISINSMFINKPPGTPRHPPHQDLYYFPFRPADKILATWTAVDEVTIENGSLYVIPGSHLNQTIYPHGNREISVKLYHGIIDEDLHAPPSKRVYMELAAGDTLIFHPYLVHGSGPNTTDRYRKVITYHFMDGSTHCIAQVNEDQKHMAQEIEAESRRQGMELSFQEIWTLKSRPITPLRSKL